MFIQQVVHITLSIPLYHTTRSFQFIHTCQQQNKTFVLLSPKKYKAYFQILQKSIVNN
jgi:hypothetical protein